MNHVFDPRCKALDETSDAMFLRIPRRLRSRRYVHHCWERGPKAHEECMFFVCKPCMALAKGCVHLYSITLHVCIHIYIQRIPNKLTSIDIYI